MPAVIQIESLTAEAFAPYGDVIETEGRDSFPINEGRADRYDALSLVDCDGQDQSPQLSLVEARQYDLPQTVTFLERHPFGSQAFVPISNTRFMVVVAAPGEDIDDSTLKAFVSNGHQGINYHRNTWHHVILTPFDAVSFIVVDRTDPGSNCVEHWYAEADQPVIDPSGFLRS